MRSFLLFMALLVLGAGVLFFFFQYQLPETTPSMVAEEQIDDQEVEAQGPILETDTNRTRGEQVEKAMYENVELDDGRTVRVLKYHLSIAAGERETGISHNPRLVIYNGKPAPEERAIIEVQAREATLVRDPEASPSSEQDFKDLKRIHFNRDVLVTFRDPAGEDDMVLRAETLDLETIDTEKKEFEIRIPGHVILATQSDSFRLEGNSLLVDRKNMSFRMGEDVSLTMRDTKIAALSALLGQEMLPKKDDGGSLDAPLVIRSRGPMKYAPFDPEDASSALPPGTLEFLENVSIEQGEAHVFGDSLTLEIRSKRKQDRSNDESPDGETDPETHRENPLVVDAIDVRSQPPRRTRFQTETGFGNCERMDWAAEKRILRLMGQPEMNMVTASQGAPAEGTVETIKISSPHHIEVIPREDPSSPQDHYRLVIPSDATVIDRQKGWRLKAPTLEADLSEIEPRTAEKEQSGDDEKKWRLDRLVLTGADEPAILDLTEEGAHIVGASILIRPPEREEDPPTISVQRLEKLTLANQGQIRDLAIIPLPDQEVSLLLGDDGTVRIDGRSELSFVDRNGRSRNLLANQYVLPNASESEGSKPPRLEAHGMVLVDDPVDMLELSGDSLLITPRGDQTDFVVSGAPARLRQGVLENGERVEQYFLEAPHIVIHPEAKSLKADGECLVRLADASLFSLEPMGSGSAPKPETPGNIENENKSSSPLELRAARVELVSGEEGPRELLAHDGVTVHQGEVQAFAASLTVTFEERRVLLQGDDSIPAEIRKRHVDAPVLHDIVRGPSILIEEGGDVVIIPRMATLTFVTTRSKKASLDPKGKDDSSSKQTIWLQSEGELRFEDRKIRSKDAVRARITTEKETYRFASHSALLRLVENEFGRLEPLTLEALGGVRMDSEKLHGEGDVLFVDYREQSILLEGRAKPCWIENERGYLMQARGIEVNYENEEFKAWNGHAAASLRER